MPDAGVQNARNGGRGARAERPGSDRSVLPCPREQAQNPEAGNSRHQQTRLVARSRRAVPAPDQGGQTDCWHRNRRRKGYAGGHGSSIIGARKHSTDRSGKPALVQDRHLIFRVLCKITFNAVHTTRHLCASRAVYNPQACAAERATHHLFSKDLAAEGSLAFLNR